MIVVLMGVSGCGKTTIGQVLSNALTWPFYDGDAFHPQANIDKMAQGIALTDADREPWLRALHDRIAASMHRGEDAIVACSALKRIYRATLAGDLANVHFVYLQGSMTLIQERLTQRHGHFMPATLLASQFEALEAPEDTLILDIAPPARDHRPGFAPGFGHITNRVYRLVREFIDGTKTLGALSTT